MTRTLRQATGVGQFLLLVVAFVMIVPAAPAREPGPAVVRGISVEYRSSGVEHRDAEKLSERSSNVLAQRRQHGRRVRALDDGVRGFGVGNGVRAADRRPSTNHAARGDRFSRPDSAWARSAHAPASLGVHRL